MLYIGNTMGVGSGKCATYKMDIEVAIDGTAVKGRIKQQGRTDRDFEATLGAGGVINGARVFGPRMLAHGEPGLIINTGSKQGITTPPGEPVMMGLRAMWQADSRTRQARDASEVSRRHLPHRHLRQPASGGRLGPGPAPLMSHYAFAVDLIHEVQSVA